MCLNQGRYGVTVKADRYQQEHRVVHLGASDQISLFSLKPKIIVHLAKEHIVADRKFTGEAISIRLLDIDVRSAVQLIADFAGKNFVVSNDVEGTISLALENIPWDLALDSILIATGNQLEERNGLFYVSKKY